MTVVFISGPIHICLYCICYKRPMRKHATLSLSLSPKCSYYLLTPYCFNVLVKSNITKPFFIWG